MSNTQNTRAPQTMGQLTPMFACFECCCLAKAETLKNPNGKLPHIGSGVTMGPVMIPAGPMGEMLFVVPLCMAHLPVGEAKRIIAA